MFCRLIYESAVYKCMPKVAIGVSLSPKKTKRNINLTNILLVLVQGKCIYINVDIYKSTTIIFSFSSYLASIFEMLLLLYSKFIFICLEGTCLIGS